MKMEAHRNGKRWSVSECLQLQREFELLHLSIVEIATRHKRTPNAIMFKLEKEGFADYDVLYRIHMDLNSHIDEEKTIEYEEEDDEDTFSELSCDEPSDNMVSTDIKNKLNSLEKQVLALTDLLSRQVKNKSLSSSSF